jgi:hypothetical protein
MKTILFILFLVIGTPVFSQDSLQISPVKLFHISTQASWNLDSGALLSRDTATGVLTAYEPMNLEVDPSALIVLSLVDSDGSITKNWDKFKEKYRNGNYLIVVDSGDGTDKLNFMTYFYQQRLKGFDIEEAYALSSERSENLSPKLLHFLNIKK